MAVLLDGKQVRDEILRECQPRVAQLASRFRVPGLAVVLVGDNPASRLYVKNKVATSEQLGLHSETITPPTTISTAEMLALVQDLNQRPDIDGILVQMPLPPQVDARAVLQAIHPAKDVDGFHPCSVGLLSQGAPGPRPCTPAGIIELLRRYRIPLEGQRAVVLGRSDIVGKPMALLLLHENATVTVCHSRTRNLAAICREADVLVAAIGKPGFVTEEFIQPGATVIDVGINRITDAQEAATLLSDAPATYANWQAKGTAVIGDVRPGHAERVAGAYTPVPGGVGPLTIAMLMVNTISLAEQAAARAC